MPTFDVVSELDMQRSATPSTSVGAEVLAATTQEHRQLHRLKARRSSSTPRARRRLTALTQVLEEKMASGRCR